MANVESSFPKWVRVRQNLENSPTISDVPSAVSRQFESPFVSAINSGDKVAIAVGSRGIDRIDEVVMEVVNRVYSLGACPYIVPAMGSHEGGTPRGQTEALASLNITQRGLDCPIEADMETVQLGKTLSGVNVYFSRAALQADHIIAISRVKKHTSFTGEVESGITKLTTVGLGKIEGARAYHSFGYHNFSRNIVQGLGVVLRHVNMPFGIAILENGRSKITSVNIVPPAVIPEYDRELLLTANSLMARLPGEKIDILFVDEIGKAISGRGMDTFVINRDYSSSLPLKPEIGFVVVRDVQGGNANGIGAADLVLERAFRKIDWGKTILNAEIAGTPEGGTVREVVENDLEALKKATRALGVELSDTRIVLIKNTKDLEEFWITDTFLPQLPENKFNIEESVPMSFNRFGMFSLKRF